MIQLTGELGSTATYASREWRFLTTAPTPAVGKLTIVCDYAKRNKVDADTYELFAAPVPPGSGRHARSFELANVETGEIYTCTVGGPDQCNCKAAQCRLDCKHVAAVRALVAEADPDTLTPRPEARASAPPVESPVE